MSKGLTVADLRFLNRVAARKFAGGDTPAFNSDALDNALPPPGGTALHRAAALVASLLRSNAFAAAPVQTALLALHCSLAFDGLSLLAPQGVLVGMIRSLTTSGDVAEFERWLEDRAVPSASGG